MSSLFNIEIYFFCVGISPRIPFKPSVRVAGFYCAENFVAFSFEQLEHLPGPRPVNENFSAHRAWIDRANLNK